MLLKPLNFALGGEDPFKYKAGSIMSMLALAGVLGSLGAGKGGPVKVTRYPEALGPFEGGLRSARAKTGEAAPSNVPRTMGDLAEIEAMGPEARMHIAPRSELGRNGLTEVDTPFQHEIAGPENVRRNAALEKQADDLIRANEPPATRTPEQATEDALWRAAAGRKGKAASMGVRAKGARELRYYMDMRYGKSSKTLDSVTKEMLDKRISELVPDKLTGE
jgi:hypothetical protein